MNPFRRLIPPAIALLIILRHIPNIKRLLSGAESRIGEKVEL